MAIIPDYFLNTRWIFEKAENTEEILEAAGNLSASFPSDFLRRSVFSLAFRAILCSAQPLASRLE
jgi:putative flippase GtrA